MKVTVLGAGLIGGPAAIDLAKDKNISVTVCDISSQALERLNGSYGIEAIQTDLSKPENVKQVSAKADLVISAVPGFMGFSCLKAVIEAGRNAVDIAFSAEDPLQLDELAKARDVTAIVDCGVAPGMSNILTAHAVSMMDEADSAVTYVGGLPQVRVLPWEYKAVFSPADVIEEYTRPARLIEHGKEVIMPALSDPELIDFPGIGTLESFNTDGLRTMLKTIKVSTMKEKTLRYPGHRQKMLMLREAGFFSSQEMEINGHKASPLQLSTKLLFPQWKLGAGEADLTVMRVRIEGKKDGKKISYQYDLLDKYDEAGGVHSMARVTGYTASMAARLLLQGLYSAKGIIPPEYLGEESNLTDFILNGLRKRGVNYMETVAGETTERHG